MVKKSACNAGDPSLIPGLWRSPGERKDYPLQYLCLESSMERGAWYATAHGSHKESDMTEQFSLYFREKDPLGEEDLYKFFCALPLELTPECLVWSSHGKICIIEVPTEGMEIPRGLKHIQCIWKQSKTKANNNNNNNKTSVSRRQGGRGVLGKEGDLSEG